MSDFLHSLKYNPFSSCLMRQYYRFRSHSLKQIVFVATTGRSGTMSLVDIFNHIPHVNFRHFETFK